MSQAARRLFVADKPSSDAVSGVAVQEHGVVLRIELDRVWVRTPAGDVEAKRAKSCLVGPEPFDIVLVSRAPGGNAYVLAVLEREEGAEPTTLTVDGDLRIAPTGKLSLRGERGVHLETPGEMHLASNVLEVNASRGSFVLGQLSVLGAKLKAEIADVRVLGDTIQSVFERVSQTMKRSFRRVEETDQVEARDARWNVEKTLHVHATNTVVTSKELVKLDGDQIHLG